VIGLLEVFSSRANAFNDRHGTILQRLSDATLAAVNRAERARARARAAENSVPAVAVGSAPTFSTASYPFAAALKETQSSADEEDNFPRRHLALLVVAALSIVAVLAYLLSPWALDRFRRPKPVEAAPAQTEPRTSLDPPPDPPMPAANLSEMRKRAEVGDPYEQAALAIRYAKGQDVQQDYSMAVRWYLRAAEQGHVGAQDALGSYFWMGRGVSKDVTKAYFWSVLARTEGKQSSKDRVAFMTSQLTRAQAAAIQQEASKFRRQHPPLLHSEAE
jgi:TPR repeat protein